jgi:peptide/nickel transport system substrate-binding protein
MWVVDALYDGLVELDEHLQIKPTIAESWTVEGLTYTFKIRNGVNFISGRKVEAKDVVYSFNRLLDPDVASSGSWILESVDSIESLDANTVQIKLKHPFPPFLGLLTTTYASIIDSESENELRSEPAGSGPFKLAWWEEEIALVMHKNPSYWEKDSLGQTLPYLDAVHVDFVPDMAAEYLGLVQGRYDFISGLHPAYMEDLMDENGDLAEKHRSQLDLYKTPFLKTDYLGVLLDSGNAGNSALQSSIMRRALSMSIDRKSIAKNLRRNSVLPSDRFVPPMMPGASSYKSPIYDLQTAQSILSDFAGTRLTISTTADYVDLCSAIQFSWEKLGLDVEIDVAPSSVQREKVATSKAQIFKKSWLADYADAENFFGLFRGANFSPGGPNYTHYYNEQFEELYNAAMIESSDSLRWKLYSQMDSVIHNDMPVIPLFHDQVTHFVSSDVKGWKVSPVNRLDLRRVKLSCANAQN